MEMNDNDDGFLLITMNDGWSYPMMELVRPQNLANCL